MIEHDRLGRPSHCELAGIAVFVWLSCIAMVLVILARDLGVFHKEAHKVSL